MRPTSEHCRWLVHMLVQPLRSSLFLHSLEDSADAAASLSLPDYADCPGPLEAGHFKARDLILTPAECKGRRSRWHLHCSESVTI